MTEEDRQELIEQYLDNSLPNPQKQLFEEQMRRDTQLADEIQLHRELEHALADDRATKVAKFRTVLSEVINAEEKVDKPKSGYARSMIFIVLSILILLVAYLFYRSQKTPQVEEKVEQLIIASTGLEELEFSLRSSELIGDTESGVEKLLMLFDAGDYQGALNWLEENSQLQEDAPNAYYYYLGIVYIKLDQWKVAQSQFERITDIYLDEKEWLSALLYLQVNGITTEGRNRIRSISSSTNIFADDAKTLLDAME
ncbi:MAG: hypothetical protein AAGG68_09315 [Bacteroidota bacterium]